MTADELRIALATALGWARCEEYFWTHPEITSLRTELPSLASLVAQAEKGLSEEQRKRYAVLLVSSVLLSLPISEADIPKAAIRLEPLEIAKLITAPTEDRAKALLEVLRP